MRANKMHNEARDLTPGDNGYLIDDDAQLALAVMGTKDGKTQIGNILGPVRATTKARALIDRSTMVQPIRAALKMDDPVTIKVDLPHRAAIVEWIAGLSDDDFSVFERAYEQAVRRR